MSSEVLKLDWCSHAAAKYAVEHWHYSRSLPTPPIVKVGVWEADSFIGCVLFSRGANNNIGKALGLKVTEVAELTRVALTSHSSPVSRIVKVAISLVRGQSPGLRCLVSYADPKQGHVGGIYQAGGWVYLGQSPDSTEYVAPDGKQWHGRMVSASGRTRVYGQTRSVWRHDQCTPVTCPGKHKYAKPLDRAMSNILATISRPYPKRAASIDSDAAGFQSAEGGAGPTAALQDS